MKLNHTYNKVNQCVIIHIDCRASLLITKFSIIVPPNRFPEKIPMRVGQRKMARAILTTRIILPSISRISSYVNTKPLMPVFTTRMCSKNCWMQRIVARRCGQTAATFQKKRSHSERIKAIAAKFSIKAAETGP